METTPVNSEHRNNLAFLYLHAEYPTWTKAVMRSPDSLWLIQEILAMPSIKTTSELIDLLSGVLQHYNKIHQHDLHLLPRKEPNSDSSNDGGGQ